MPGRGFVKVCVTVCGRRGCWFVSALRLRLGYKRDAVGHLPGRKPGFRQREIKRQVLPDCPPTATLTLSVALLTVRLQNQ